MQQNRYELYPDGFCVGKVMPVADHTFGSDLPDRDPNDLAPRKIWPWPTILLETAAEWIMELPGDAWLDAACGESPLAKYIGKQKQLIGLDIDGFRLKQASRCLFHSLTQASVTHLPFSDDSLDGVVSIETLEHVEDIAAALKEFSRCVKPNCYFLVTMPAVTLRSWWDMRRTGRPIYCSETQHVRELSAVPIRGFKHRFQLFRSLEDEFKKAGFVVKRKSGVGYLFPRWKRGLAFLEHGMNLFYREGLNRLFSYFCGFR